MSFRSASAPNLPSFRQRSHWMTLTTQHRRRVSHHAPRISRRRFRASTVVAIRYDFPFVNFLSALDGIKLNCTIMPTGPTEDRSIFFASQASTYSCIGPGFLSPFTKFKVAQRKLFIGHMERPRILGPVPDCCFTSSATLWRVVKLAAEQTRSFCGLSAESLMSTRRRVPELRSGASPQGR